VAVLARVAGVEVAVGVALAETPTTTVGWLVAVLVAVVVGAVAAETGDVGGAGAARLVAGVWVESSPAT
jgi:hypothetical protein